jgi:hypothetical protein
MGVTIVSAAEDKAQNETRRSIAARVIEQFGSSPPSTRTIVFLDGWDWPDLKANGKENRGLFTPINKYSFRDWDWPLRLREELAAVDPDTLTIEYMYDSAIYLHNSSCQCEAGLIMTLAHEIQHLVQYGNDQNVWAYNGVITNLTKTKIKELGLAWPDIPVEREARTVAKRVLSALRRRGNISKNASPLGLCSATLPIGNSSRG